MPNQAGSQIGFSLNETVTREGPYAHPEQHDEREQVDANCTRVEPTSEKLKFNPSVNDQWNVGVRT
jgi:hypothetical protein